MNFFFIVDTSFSMMQVCNHYSLLDLAKVIIERFVDVRVKSQESKFDRYFVSSTCPTEYDIIPYTLPLDSYIFNVHLKTILVSHQTNAVKSIIKAYTVLNEFRLLYEHDNFMGGRDPFKTDSSIVIFITDGSNASFVDTINEVLRSDFLFSRWDQQFFTFLLNPLDARNRNLKNRPAPRNYSKILDLCQTLNGNCLLLDSPDTIPNFIETFLTRLRHKISLSFKRIKLENFKYDVSLQPQLGKMQASTIPKLEQDAVAEPELKGRLIIRPSTGHLSTKFSASHAHMIAARYPFPEDPYSVTPGKFVQKLSIDMSYESEASYPSAPLYYIDFTKFFLGKLAFDFPLDRFEIDSGSEIYNFVCEYVKGYPNLNKIVFPVFFNNLYGMKQAAKMEIFALLRYVRSELDNSIGMELLVYPLNFPAFNDIWEEASKFGSGQTKMKAEFTPELTQKLEIFFEKTPFYYSNYLFALFSHKKMGDYINRKWRFFTNFCSLNLKNTDLTNLQMNVKKYIPEKAKKKQENDLQIGALKAKRNTNPEEIIAENRRAIQKAKEEKQQAPGVAEHNKTSLISRVLAMKDELFAPQVHEAGVKGENHLCSKPMSKMSNYHEYMAKFAPLKNPHEEDTERKFYKEPIPFGNPFKYVVRSKQSSITDNYEDQAFLTSFNQLPLVDRNKNDRGVSPRGPQKPVHDPAKEKHRLSTQSFNLKSLQTALEVSSGRSTPVSSPVSMSTVESAKSDYNFTFEEVKEKEPIVMNKPKEKEKDSRARSLENIAQRKKMEEEKKDKSEKVDKVEKQKKKPEKPEKQETQKKIVAEPVKAPKKKVNPYYFMVCNATVFKDFAMFLKDPPKPTLTESVEEHVRREGMRIVESLDVKNTPDILKVVLWKLDDMLKVYNYRNVKLENGFKQYIIGV